MFSNLIRYLILQIFLLPFLVSSQTRRPYLNTIWISNLKMCFSISTRNVGFLLFYFLSRVFWPWCLFSNFHWLHEPEDSKNLDWELESELRAFSSRIPASAIDRLLSNRPMRCVVFEVHSFWIYRTCWYMLSQNTICWQTSDMERYCCSNSPWWIGSCDIWLIWMKNDNYIVEM